MISSVVLYRWMTIALRALFVAGSLSIGVASELRDNEAANSAVFLLLLALLVVAVARVFVKISAEVDIWYSAARNLGLASIDELRQSFARLPKLGPVFSAGVQQWRVEDAFVDLRTNSVLQRVTCIYGGAEGSSLSFGVQYVVMVIPLEVEVPSLFIDGLRQNIFKKSTDMWSLNKKLLQSTKAIALEGDFRKYFNVYTQRQNQLDALTILTPDVMLELRDRGYEFDYELYQNSLCVIRDANLRSADDLEQFARAAYSCAREFVPQITGHTFTPAPPLPLAPRRTMMWGYIYTMRVLGLVLFYLVALVAIGGVGAQLARSAGLM